MKTHVVRQGDYVAKIAAGEGLTEEAVWNDPANKDLAALRQNPNVLLPGDVLRLPDPPRATSRVTKGSSNAYTALVRPVRVSLAFAHRGEVLAGAAYEVHGLGKVVAGTTDGDGRATIEATTRVDEFVVKFAAQKLAFRARIGHLDPAAEPSGAAHRLANLGHALPGMSPRLHQQVGGLVAKGTFAREFETSLKAFQKANGLAQSGEVDDETSRGLIDAHGS
jgi:hypothetical protein